MFGPAFALQGFRQFVIDNYINFFDLLDRNISLAGNVSNNPRDIEFLQKLSAKIMLGRQFAGELRDHHDAVSNANLLTAMEVIRSTLLEARDLPIARQFFVQFMNL